MFSFRSFLKLSAVAAAALIIASCGKGKPVLASKGNMIPDNAVMAMKLDANQLLDKTFGEPGSQGRELLNMGRSMASMSLGEFGEFGTVIRNVIQNPAELGVCLEEPVVLSATADLDKVRLYDEGSMEIYLVALLNNREAFEKVVDATAAFAEFDSHMKVVKEATKEYTHYVLADDNDASLDLGVSDESAVLRFRYHENTGKIDLKTTMRGLFANGGPAHAESMETLYAANGELAVWYNLEQMFKMMMPIVEEVDPFTAADLKKSLPLYEGCAMVADLAFLKGQTVLDCHFFASEKVKEMVRKYNAQASDKYLSYLPSSAFIAGNFAFKNLPDLMKMTAEYNPQSAEVMEQLELMFGIDEQFLAGLSGTTTFGVDGHGLMSLPVPGFVCITECDRYVWDFVKTEISDKAQYVGSDMYNLMDMAYLSYDNGHMMLADAVTMQAGPLGGAESFAETELAQTIKNGGLMINLEALPYALLNEMAKEFDSSYLTADKLIEYISSVTFTPYDDNMASKLVFNMGDKQHTILEKLVLEGLSNIRLY